MCTKLALNIATVLKVQEDPRNKVHVNLTQLYKKKNQRKEGKLGHFPLRRDTLSYLPAPFQVACMLDK